MPVSVVIGGQFGSEGKGKVSHFFAKRLKAKAVVRVGGPNSGHTVITDDGAALVLRQLPTASIIKGVHSVLPSGCYLDVSLLQREILLTKIDEISLHIDPFAFVISDLDKEAESASGLKDSIGSTGSGTGSAVSRRANRQANAVFAKDVPELARYVRDTKQFLRKTLDANGRVIIEGTQGFGLSLLHAQSFPFATSRDTSAAGFVSEAGLSPLDVDDVIMVLRAFPIRVGGNSGPLPGEINWKEVSNRLNDGREIIEYTSVTKKVRRVADFHPDVVIRAIEVNRPTRIILNHLDYVAPLDGSGELPLACAEFLERVENLIGNKIACFGFDREGLHGREDFSIAVHPQPVQA